MADTPADQVVRRLPLAFGDDEMTRKASPNAVSIDAMARSTQLSMPVLASSAGPSRVAPLRTASTTALRGLDHELRSIQLDVVAAVGGDDLPCAGHELGELALQLVPDDVELLGGESRWKDAFPAGGVAAGQHDERHRPQRLPPDRGAHLLGALRHQDPFELGVAVGEVGRRVLRREDEVVDELGRSDLREAFDLVLAAGIDEDHAGDLVGVGAGVEADEEPADRMGHEHVRPGLTGGLQQRMEVGDHIARGARLRRRIAAGAVLVVDGPRAVVDAQRG